MLTPQDVQEKTFAKAVFGGYDMASVDEFLEGVSADYAALYKENAILKSKLKILVDKVEEYRSTESAMRQALLDTQKKCDDMISDAEKQRDQLAAQAQAEADEQKQKLAGEVRAEEKRLEAARASTAEYVDMVNELCRKQLDFLKDLGKLEIAEEKEPAAGYENGPNDEKWVADTAKEIELSLQRLEAQQSEPEAESAAPAQEAEPAAEAEKAEPAKAEAEEIGATKVFPKIKPEDLDNSSPKPRFHFENLQFGTNYKADADD